MNFTKEIITEQTASQLGHVFWTKEEDPINAMRDMREAVMDAPINFAIWENASCHVPTELISTVHDWRNRFHFNFKGKVCEPHTPKEILKFLDGAFSLAADKPSSEIVQCQEQHVDFEKGIKALGKLAHLRTKFLLQALDPKSIIVRPRVHKGAKVRVEHNLHIDRPNPYVNIRFLDSVDCPHTCLVSNVDTISDEKGNITYREASLKDPIRVFECPKNSFVLITQPGHPHLPILHSENFVVNSGEPLIPRTTISYDLAWN